MIKKVMGNLITMALTGNFDVIAHGCNCQNVMGAGIAPKMAKIFGCDQFTLEQPKFKGHIDKLGRIDFTSKTVIQNGLSVIVVNCYTQFDYGKNHIDGVDHPLDYEALRLCMRKMNHIFRGQRIGLPWIGCGLAGGNKVIVEDIIRQELQNCEVTIVEYDNS